MLCLHGFERCASTEEKYRSLAPLLMAHDLVVVQLDFGGIGLSDGDFADTTIERQKDDLVSVSEAIMKKYEIDVVSVIAHSL